MTGLSAFFPEPGRLPLSLVQHELGLFLKEVGLSRNEVADLALGIRGLIGHGLSYISAIGS